jgi:hypothetical protein
MVSRSDFRQFTPRGSISEHAVALRYCTTISVGFTKRYALTPAMEAGISDDVGDLDEIIDLLEPDGV